MPPATRASLRTKVPAAMALVILASLGIFGLSSVRSARAAELRAADARISALAQYLGGLLTDFYAGQVATARSVAEDMDVIRTLRSPGRADTLRALAALRRMGPLGSPVTSLELRDRSGRVVLGLGDVVDRAQPRPTRQRAAGVSPLAARGDTTRLEVVAPVVVGGESLGWVARVVELTRTGEGLAMVTRLLDRDASLIFGNADGSYWTNLNRPIDFHRPGAGEIYERDGIGRLAAVAPIANTPWLVGVEIPSASVLQPVREMILDLTLIGLAIVGLATLMAFFLTRRLIEPVADLSRAAEAIAAGDLDVEARSAGRGDEIGFLARSFNVMAANVRRSHDELEAKVGNRTAELEEALSELRDAQGTLLRRERLATLGELASSVGHELRNPLGVIANSAYYLDAVLPDPAPKVKKHLDILRQQVFVSEKIVSDLLDFARVKLPIRSRETAEDLIDEALARIEVPSCVRVRREIPAGLPRVEVDPVQIAQILINLVTNAVESLQDEGGEVSVRCEAEGEVVRVVVSDDGSGVPEVDRERIFEPLFTTKSRGIGLGLSVSRSLARSNDGDLKLAHAENGGATFLLELPRAVHHVELPRAVYHGRRSLALEQGAPSK